MKKIYKYSVKPTMALPKDHKVLSIGWQEGKQVLWAEVGPCFELKEVQTLIICTGWEVPDNHKHALTWCEGPLVWHLYVSNDVNLKTDDIMAGEE